MRMMHPAAMSRAAMLRGRVVRLRAYERGVYGFTGCNWQEPSKPQINSMRQTLAGGGADSWWGEQVRPGPLCQVAGCCRCCGRVACWRTVGGVAGAGTLTRERDGA